MPLSSGIYAIINNANDRIYVGQTHNFRTRWRKHADRLRAGTHPNKHLLSAWRKYGEGAFAFTVLEYVEDNTELLTSAEQKWMDAFEGHRLYNLAPAAGSTRGITLTPEHRAKVLAAIHTPEAAAKSAASRVGRKHSPERCANISAGQKGRVQSEATRQKISETKRQRNAERRNRAA